MTSDDLDDLDTWQFIYSQFVCADSKSGVSFALNDDPEAQGSCKLRIITVEMSYGKWLLDIHNTNDAACNAKEHSRKQRNSPRYDRSQNPPISPEHDLTYYVITY